MVRAVSFVCAAVVVEANGTGQTIWARSDDHRQRSIVKG